MKTLLLSSFSAFLFLPFLNAAEAAKPLKVPIDEVFENSTLWEQTPDALETAWRNKGFRWISPETKDRGHIRRVKNHGPGLILTANSDQLNVEEILFQLKNGKVAELTVHCWNKGDSDGNSLSEKEFETMVEAWSAYLNLKVAPKFEDRGKDTTSAAKAERRLWTGKNSLTQLEFSGGKNRVPDIHTGRMVRSDTFQGEFIRLRILPKPANGTSADLNTGGKSAVRVTDLTKNLLKSPNGDVMIQGIPMVDQGDKGYCAVATAARILNYYGIPADQHEMAQVAGTDAGGGTNAGQMRNALRKLSGKYQIRYTTLLDRCDSERGIEDYLKKYNRAAKKLGKREIPLYGSGDLGSMLDADVLRESHGEGSAVDKFTRIVQEKIDRGTPIIWALQLGLFPEEGLKAKQLSGGHMRLIIGYNLPKKEIIFSDTWGSGHEQKRMAIADACAATTGAFLMQPSR